MYTHFNCLTVFLRSCCLIRKFNLPTTEKFRPITNFVVYANQIQPFPIVQTWPIHVPLKSVNPQPQKLAPLTLIKGYRSDSRVGAEGATNISQQESVWLIVAA